LAALQHAKTAPGKPFGTGDIFLAQRSSRSDFVHEPSCKAEKKIRKEARNPRKKERRVARSPGASLTTHQYFAYLRDHLLLGKSADVHKNYKTTFASMQTPALMFCFSCHQDAVPDFPA
jgi:hypothetical protein